MLSLQKSIISSLFTPQFFIQKFISVAERFLRGGGSSLKRTYIKGEGTCKTNRDEQRDCRASKNRKFQVKVLFE